MLPLAIGLKLSTNILKDDLKPYIEIAAVYFKSTPMLKPTSNSIVNTNNSNLYVTDDCNPDYVSMKLRKGTHVMIISGKRIFMPDEFLDIYKVRVNLGKKKTVTGWMNGYELDEAKEEAKSIDNQKTYTATKKIKKAKALRIKERLKYELHQPKSKFLIYDKELCHNKKEISNLTTE